MVDLSDDLSFSSNSEHVVFSYVTSLPQAIPSDRGFCSSASVIYLHAYGNLGSHTNPVIPVTIIEL